MTSTQVFAILNKRLKLVQLGIDRLEVDGTILIFHLKDGSTLRMQFPDPLGIYNIEIRQIDKEPHLICIMTDGSEIDAGVFPRGGGNCVYVGVTEPVDPMVQVWINPAEDGGGGIGSVTYTGVAGVSVGGIREGDEFFGEPIQNVIDKLLSPPYAKPKITIGINPTAVLYDVEEDTLDKLTISANVTKMTEEIKYIKYYVDTTLVETLTEDVKDGGVFKSTQTFDPVKKETFTVKVETCDVDTQSIVSATTKIKFIGKTYYGIVPEGTDIDETAIRGLNTLLKDSKGYTYDGITTEGTDLYHIVFAQPAVYGEITSIIDSMNFEYIQDYTPVTMKFGEGDDAIDYNVVYLTEPASVTDFMQKFS